MAWTVQRIHDEHGEDILRDICRDINDLMSGRAGHGHHANRIGVPDEIWRKLLLAGGFTDEGAVKAMAGDHLLQSDTTGPFRPYTIVTLVNIAEDLGGPLTGEELDTILGNALRYRELLQ